MVQPCNRLLAALSTASLHRISSVLTRRRFGSHAIVRELDAPIDVLLFVESGMASITITNPDGQTIEVAAVGREGVIGVEATFGFTTSPSAICYQIPGEALVMPITAFRSEVEAAGELSMLVRRYAQVRYVQMMQAILCNRCHTLEQRMARWLLMARDYTGADRVPLTQRVIAELLGVYRPAVTTVAATLQQGGLITYDRGVVTIANPRGLERIACSCYGLVRRQFERLLPAARLDGRPRC